MKKIFTLVLLFFIVLLPLSLSVQASSEDSCMMRAGHFRDIKIWEELNLTKEQKEKLKELHKEMVELRKSHIDSVKNIRASIKEELLKDTPSKSALERYASTLGEFHKSMTIERLEHLLKVKNILTKEQFEKLVSMEEKGFGLMEKPFRRPPSPHCPYGKGERRCGKGKPPFDDD